MVLDQLDSLKYKAVGLLCYQNRLPKRTLLSLYERSVSYLPQPPLILLFSSVLYFVIVCLICFGKYDMELSFERSFVKVLSCKMNSRNPYKVSVEISYIYVDMFSIYCLYIFAIRHWMKSVQIRSYCWSVCSCIRIECGPETIPYLDTFHAVRVTFDF